MIKLNDLTVENFRSIIGSPPLTLAFGDFTVITGPNNSGKSNALRALDLFFNGIVDGSEFSIERDYPKFNLGNRANTKITVTLTFTPSQDVRLERAVAALEKESGIKRLAPNQIRLRLSYTRGDAEILQFFGQAGARSAKEELVKEVLASVRATARFKYLPVGRDIAQTIKNELTTELVETIFSAWGHAQRAKLRLKIDASIQELIKNSQSLLKTSGTTITDSISGVFSEIKRMELKLPFDNLESMLGSLNPAVSDSYETDLNSKGAGIQTSSLLFLLKYIADNRPQRHNNRVTYIWGIEEPESYLHPSRQRRLCQVLQGFSKEVQTIITTHSPHFVPRKSTDSVYVLEKSATTPYSTLVAGKDYEHARNLLGASLVDTLYLFPINLVVEGPSDEILFRGVLERLYSEKRIPIDPTDVKFFPGGNADGACHLFEAFKSFGEPIEVFLGLVLDGDDAGRKAFTGLQRRYSSKESTLSANYDYFQLPSTSEFLASDRVKLELQKAYPGKVTLTTNTSKEITGFEIHDGHKRKIAQEIVSRSKVDDLGEFEKLFKLLGVAIEKGKLKAAGSS